MKATDSPEDRPGANNSSPKNKRAVKETAEPASASAAFDLPVHFEFFDPAASKVCIAGTFNGWNPEVTEMSRLGPGRWEKDLLLPPGDYEYRLVVDGRWIPDPSASRTVPGPFGDPNSLLSVPTMKS